MNFLLVEDVLHNNFVKRHLAIGVQKFKIIYSDYCLLDQSFFWHAVQLTYVDVDQTSPEKQNFRGKLLDHLVEFNHAETVNFSIIRNSLHHHDVLKCDAGCLEKQKFKFKIALLIWLNPKTFRVSKASIQPPSDQNFSKQVNFSLFNMNPLVEIFDSTRSDNQNSHHGPYRKWNFV